MKPCYRKLLISIIARLSKLGRGICVLMLVAVEMDTVIFSKSTAPVTQTIQSGSVKYVGCEWVINVRVALAPTQFSK
jgi:hypothetical protein